MGERECSHAELQKIKIECTMDYLSKACERNYSNLEQQMGNIIVWSTHLALENIANSDAIYHNVEHTVLATLAGQAILERKHLSEGGDLFNAAGLKGSIYCRGLSLAEPF